ncbi:MAG TPA: SusD/RagB family nutrient-binding outer membrane lipoprotein, partial [Paludibacter sp.]|nr:SusD/RagB family nutrient-binding outer membrane lipoprotein [Paludibacter sp.]
MKKILISLAILSTVFIASSCDDYLDVNKNIDTPDWVEPNLRLAPILSGFTSNYWDARIIAPMSQYLNGSTVLGATYGAQMYYAPTSDYAETFKMVYWIWGQNLEDMINDGKKLNQPLYAGIGLALKAYGWYQMTSIHGELPCKQFLDPGRTVFDYDSQEYIYSQSRQWAKEAIDILSKADATVYPASLKNNDLMYKGDKSKWLKFAYGVLAKNYITISGKNVAYLDSAITAVNNSMTSQADDATVINAGGSVSAQVNFFGVLRGNLSTALNQSDYMVDLMTGKVKLFDTNTGNLVTSGGVDQLMAKQYITDTLTLDPRAICYFGTTDTMPNDLNSINLKTYKFVGTKPGQASQVTLFGTTAAPSAATSGIGRWIFRDNAPYLIMTYSELQFIKAEAEYRKNMKSEALATFKKAVDASIKTTAAYIVPGTAVKGTNGKQSSVIGDKISSAKYNSFATTYLNSAYVNNLPLADFELAHVMMQKYV